MSEQREIKLRVSGLTKSFGENQVLRGIDLELPAGLRSAPVSYTHLTLPTILLV